MKTGETLWQTRLGTSVQGYPVTFSAGGRQYVAVTTGLGGGSPRACRERSVPDVRQPLDGNAIYVVRAAGSADSRRRASLDMDRGRPTGIDADWRWSTCFTRAREPHSRRRAFRPIASRPATQSRRSCIDAHRCAFSPGLRVLLSLVTLAHAQAQPTDRRNDDRRPGNQRPDLALDDRVVELGTLGQGRSSRTFNLITPTKRKQALRLARDGVAVSLRTPWTRHSSRQSAADRAADDARTPPGTPMDLYSIWYHGSTITHIDALCHYSFEERSTTASIDRRSRRARAACRTASSTRRTAS